MKSDSFRRLVDFYQLLCKEHPSERVLEQFSKYIRDWSANQKSEDIEYVKCELPFLFDRGQSGGRCRTSDAKRDLQRLFHIYHLLCIDRPRDQRVMAIFEDIVEDEYESLTIEERVFCEGGFSQFQQLKAFTPAEFWQWDMIRRKENSQRMEQLEHRLKGSKNETSSDD